MIARRCEKCNSTSSGMSKALHRESCTFIDDSGQAWVSAFNESALELFGKVDADQLAVYKEEVDGEDGKFESYMKQFNFQRYVLKLRAKADTWNEQTRVKVSIADVKPGSATTRPRARRWSARSRRQHRELPSPVA